MTLAWHDDEDDDYDEEDEQIEIGATNSRTETPQTSNVTQNSA